MSDYILCCGSAADLSEEHLKRRNIEYISFCYELGGKEYKDDLGKTIPFPEFYKRMQDGEMTKTSQINVEEFVEYFTPFFEAGKDVLYVSLSSGLSGVYDSACLAKKELEERFPDRRIYVVDSLGASSGYGLLMDELADLRDGGMEIEKLYEWANEHRLNLHHWFYSTDLSYYVRGGRITKAEGWFGTVLNICPLLNMDNLGHLVPRYKIRGKKKVIKAIVDKMEEHAQDGLNYSGKCYISHADCIEDAQLIAQMVKDRFKNLNGDVLINYIGSTIGSHTGPGTVALFFFGDKRED